LSSDQIHFTDHDLQIWEEELKEFVPARVFDAHIHLFNPEHMQSTESTWSYADLRTIQRWAKRLYPGREVHFLVLGTPATGHDVDAHNHWAIEQVQRDPQSRMNRLVTPQCSTDDIRRDVTDHGFLGLKPYRIYSTTGDIHQCRIREFLTPDQMELANDLGLWVTMHLSRFHGCADEWNLTDLEEYTTHRYPNIKWILAHCARSFTYWPIREAVDRLRDLPNIWYDLSAVTDVRPLITLFTKEDSRRILYGSDGVDATYFHGQYVALGRAWQSLDTSRFELQFPHCDGRAILAIYEQLLSMKQAADIAGLSTDDVDNIFWRNATAAFDVEFSEPLIPPSAI
jgi:predicted TIM-barrel fold metal-dependent hydrolase